MFFDHTKGQQAHTLASVYGLDELRCSQLYPVHELSPSAKCRHWQYEAI
jgi:hypothetical protein